MVPSHKKDDDDDDDDDDYDCNENDEAEELLGTAAQKPIDIDKLDDEKEKVLKLETGVQLVAYINESPSPGYIWKRVMKLLFDESK